MNRPAIEDLKRAIAEKNCFGAAEATALIDALLAPDPSKPKPKGNGK